MPAQLKYGKTHFNNLLVSLFPCLLSSLASTPGFHVHTLMLHSHSIKECEKCASAFLRPRRSHTHTSTWGCCHSFPTAGGQATFFWTCPAKEWTMSEHSVPETVSTGPLKEAASEIWRFFIRVSVLPLFSSLLLLQLPDSSGHQEQHKVASWFHKPRRAAAPCWSQAPLTLTSLKREKIPFFPQSIPINHKTSVPAIWILRTCYFLRKGTTVFIIIYI